VFDLADHPFATPFQLRRAIDDHDDDNRSRQAWAYAIQSERGAMAHRILVERGRPSQSGASPFAHLQGRATALLNTVLQRAECVKTADNPGLCEKPAISSQSTTWIIVGVIIGLILAGTLAVLLFLHMRRRKRDRQEDVQDQFQMSDYGLDDGAMAARPRKTEGQARLSFDDLPRPGVPANGARNPFSDEYSPNRSSKS